MSGKREGITVQISAVAAVKFVKQLKSKIETAPNKMNAETTILPSAIESSTSKLLVSFSAHQSAALATILKHFIEDHADAKVSIQTHTSITSDLDVARISDILSKASALPGDPTIDPPKPKPQRARTSR